MSDIDEDTGFSHAVLRGTRIEDLPKSRDKRIAKLEQQNAALREAMFKACGQCMHGDAKRAADTLSAALAQEDGG